METHRESVSCCEKKLGISPVITHYGIPTQALGIAMMADILMGFVAAALDQVFSQLEMILLADDAQILDKERLHSNV